ncbi:hypothetical protein D1007_18168 [Hordeum vulgare]|nr:hypothetical protein D1007_18168 [Hordeum vulgare]
MGLFPGAGSSKAKGKSPVIPFPSEFLPPLPASARRPRQRVNVRVHQAESHWQHRVPLPWARWFSFEHEDARRHDVREVDRTVPPPPLVIREEDQAAEDVYQAALAAVYRECEEDERRRAVTVEQEEAAHEGAMAEAMALSTAGDCDMPSMTPLSRVKVEPEPSPIERYSWTGVVREWVSAPPVWVGATSTQEAYLEMIEHDAEEEARQAAVQPAPDMNALWNTTLPWAGPAPTLIDLTNTKNNDAAPRAACRLIV